MPSRREAKKGTRKRRTDGYTGLASHMQRSTRLLHPAAVAIVLRDGPVVGYAGAAVACRRVTLVRRRAGEVVKKGSDEV